MQTNVFAYTSLDATYPEYLSVNLREGAIEVTVRGPKHPATRAVPWETEGGTVRMTLPPEQAKELGLALLRQVGAPAKSDIEPAALDAFKL